MNISSKSYIQTLVTALVAIFISGCSTAPESTEEWPSFHGSDRTNKSFETGLLNEWPEGGPDLEWKVTGLEEGYSTIIIADGHIYASGLESGQTTVFCFDLDGKLAWKSANGKAWSTTLSWAASYTGARSTPTFSEGIIYHLGEGGRLAAFDAETGSEIWFKNLPEEYDAEMTEYGYAESVLIEGDNLYVRPAGKKGFQVCLDKNDGSLIWANTDIPGSEGYSSAVLMDFGGFHQIVASSSNCYYGVDTETGKLLWKTDFENSRGLNITDAIVYNEYVFFTSGYGKGSKLIRLNVSDGEIIPALVWESEIMDNHHGGVILHDGYLYGSGSNSRGWFCIEFLTGKQIWNEDGKGSITFADGLLYFLDERSGNMKLVRATPEKFDLKGEFDIPRGGEGMYWAHPVVCGGRLYVRHADVLYAYDISI